MNKIEIENAVYNDIISHKHEAEHQAEIRYYKALLNPEFEEIDKKIRASIIERGRCEFDGKSTAEVDKNIIKLKKEREEVLKKMNMTLESLRPQYSCKLCNDEGFVGNTRCTCFQNRVTKALFENSNLGSSMTRNFADFDCSIYDSPEFGAKILKLGEYIVESKGKYRVPIILIRGEVGSGKTFFLECVANELIKQNVAVIFMPAFELSQNLLEWHLGDLEEKNILQQVFVDCDVLFIDDLGTEPIYKNVSLEYLQNIIDIRIMKNKLTIISTNLDGEGFLDRYGDRLSSRIYISDNAFKLEIGNSDLRKKSKDKETKTKKK